MVKTKKKLTKHQTKGSVTEKIKNVVNTMPYVFGALAEQAGKNFKKKPASKNYNADRRVSGTMKKGGSTKSK